MFFPRADWREGLQNFVTPVRGAQGGPRVRILKDTDENRSHHLVIMPRFDR